MPIDSYLAGGRPRDRDQAAARIAALQADLERLRSDRDDQVARLERQLTLARTALPTERNASAVASNLAAQQQIDALRLALQEKDRVIDELSATVRALEDKLEDHYRNLDYLNQQLHQSDRQRTEAEDRVARAERRLARARAASEGHRGALDSSSSSVSTNTPVDPSGRPDAAASPAPAPDWELTPAPPTGSHLASAAQRRAPPPSPGPRKPGAGAILLAALLGAAMVLVITAALWWSGHWWPQPRSLSPANPATMPTTNALWHPSDNRHG